MPRHTLSKRERVYLREEVRGLFASRRAFVSYPYRVVFAEVEKQEVPVKMMVSVPKRRFKRAVDRNRLKRLTREGYRLLKQTVVEPWGESDKTLLVGFVYIGSEVVSYERIREGIAQALTKLAKWVNGVD